MGKRRNELLKLRGLGAALILAGTASFAAAQEAQSPAATPPNPVPMNGQAQPPAQAGQPGAEQQAKTPQPPRQLSGTTTGWVKICQKIPNTDKEGCQIQQEVYAENGAFLASMAVQEVSGEQRRQLLITTPLGMALQAGLLVRTDNEKAQPAKFGTCLVNGCFAGLEIGMDLVNTMKKGQNAFITVRNIQGAALDLTVPLATFAKAYDGPAMDIAALQEQQKKLQEELLHRAEKAREELMKQQNQSGTQPPPATGTTPPAKSQ